MPVFQNAIAVEQNFNWQKEREYYIPKSKINWEGKNTIAICVYDGYENGGIREGNLELITREEFQLREKNNHYNFEDIIELIFD